MKLTLTLAIALLSLNTQAQELCFGKKEFIYSGILKEERDYLIYVPEMKDGERLPLRLILDAEINFPLLVASQLYLTRGRVPQTDKAIIVGILNTWRTRDLTPSHVENKGIPGTQRGGDYTETGGAPAFLQFLNNELLPLLEQKYPVNKDRTLIGHSFGGLTVLYACFKQAAGFNSFVAVDPSLWWDDEMILKLAKQTKPANLENRKLFIAISGEAGSGMLQLRKTIENTGLKSPTAVKNFPAENHGTIMLPALSEFLKSDKH